MFRALRRRGGKVELGLAGVVSGGARWRALTYARRALTYAHGDLEAGRIPHWRTVEGVFGACRNLAVVNDVCHVPYSSTHADTT